MEDPVRTSLARAGVSLTDVTLHHVLFSDRNPPAGEPDDPPEYAGFSLELEAVRASALHLAVALTLSARSGLPFELSVTYAAHFEMDASIPAQRRDAVWRDVSRRAPEILFPYIRELVTNLTARWGEAPLLLPPDPEQLGWTPRVPDIPPAPADVEG
jgi:preprotein translocase subunit SecB